jgi:Transglycosylase SLT domain
MSSARYARTRAQRRRRLAFAGVTLAVIIAIVLVITHGGSSLPGAPPAANAPETGAGGLFHYDASDSAQYIARVTAGNGQVLFAKSPGGAVATAERVAAFRPMIDRAVAGTNIPATALEGLVFLESAGLPDAAVDGNPTNAAGLTQILPSTATMLHLHVDVAASQRLLAEIAQTHNASKLRSLQGQLQAADQRFDPADALAATVRLLQQFEQLFGGRLDLAVTAYHMGPGNMQQILSDYDGGQAVPYVQLYFDTAPDHNASAYKLLSSLGDDSSLYWWRVLGAEQIMHLYQTGRAALTRLQNLETSDAAGGSVLHPPGRGVGGVRYASPSALQAAYTSRQLVPLPRNAAALGLAYDTSIGSQASQVSAPRSLYEGLNPVAIKLLIRMAAAVRTLSGGQAPLHVAGAVADGKYLAKQGAYDPMAQTGFSFEIARRYRSGAQAAAFQAVLDRLQSLDLIAWAPVGSVIQITAASDAGSWKG